MDKELEVRINSSAQELQGIIQSLSQRCAQLAADNGALKMKLSDSQPENQALKAKKPK